MDYRVEFSKWWITEFKTIKFPSAGTVFDYCIDRETKKFVPWTEMVPKFELDLEVPLQVNQRRYFGRRKKIFILYIRILLKFMLM